jgi:DNA-binding transcriptional ArsR family regulator
MLTIETDPLTSALRALAEPRRREILRLVRESELTSGQVAAHFDVTGPAISQHLGVLVEAGLVSVRREGTKRYYRAMPKRLGDISDYLSEFWITSLGRLAEAAEQEERRSKDASTN